MKIKHLLIAALLFVLVPMTPPSMAAMTIDEAAIAEIEVRDFDANTRTSFRRCLVFFDNMTLNLSEANYLTAKCIDTESVTTLTPQEEPVEPTFPTFYDSISIDTGWTVPAPPQHTLDWDNCALWKRRYQLMYPPNMLPRFYAKYTFDCNVKPISRPGAKPAGK